ncbi:type II secretion system protein GspC [Polyangium aurulentum]|uniref:type II secretion system protein GspC n=1 Tax=Polyangium aurulentum TaxID=2567896 RepID=UPI0010ADE3E2|nr:type II secretion system protein GspC [Polyangium aurulentum]UQA60810.1 general secretion pathway protein GspC [Polyangium aurulentum]
MGLDGNLKRYFPAVICVLIAVAAYFQASGMGQLVASSALLDPSSMPPPPPSPPRVGPSLGGASGERSISADPILSRNPFDSVTGPLDGKPIDVNPQAEAASLNTDPYADPVCDVAKVLLITQSEDPDWSFAAIAGSDGKSQLRRRGDDIAGHKVDFIGWDRVWLTMGNSRCQMPIHGGEVPKKLAAAPASPGAAGDAPPTSSRKGKKIDPALAAKIHKISETQYDIERSAIDHILENQADLMRSARIVPEKEGDKVVGIRLFGVRPDSLLGTLGIENGDRLQSINGIEMNDTQKALEAYARLRSTDKLSVSVNRRGKPMTIDFNIK